MSEAKMVRKHLDDMLYVSLKFCDMLQKHVQGKFCSLGNHIEWITVQSGLTFTSICGCFMVAAKSNPGLSNMKRPRTERLVFFKLSITFEVASNIYLCSQHSAPVPPLPTKAYIQARTQVLKTSPFHGFWTTPTPFNRDCWFWGPTKHHFSYQAMRPFCEIQKAYRQAWDLSSPF